MPHDGTFSIISSYLSAARATGRVYGKRFADVAWTDIGTPEQLEALRERVKV
jgi:NDP-sugar pyrophosphorylase family protein